MELNDLLRNYAKEKLGVSKDAGDEIIRAALTKALGDGTLKVEEFAKMKAGVTEDPRAKLNDVVAKAVADAVNPTIASLGETLKEALASLKPAAPAEKAVGDGAKLGSAEDAQKLFGNGTKVETIRAHEHYSKSCSNLLFPEKHVKAGEQAFHEDGRPIESKSEYKNAIAGAWAKLQIVGDFNRLNDHDKDLIDWTLKNEKFVGDCKRLGKSFDNRKIDASEQKALFDDATSGGLEAVPIVFDDAVITIPLLHGELFPMVDVVTTNRRRVEGWSIGSPTFVSTAEGSAITQFTTTGFVAALDSTVFPVSSILEVGTDFMEDAPNNIGQIITNLYGEELLRWLDEQIAIGDGTTEPEGIFTASGTTSVSSANGSTGALTVGDAEALIFGVSKAYRNAKGRRNAFISNDTTYRKFRAINVGSSDQRRVFGMDHMNYELLSFPHKVQANIPNTKVAFANLGYYRMYRRAGISVRMETGGITLARSNLQAIVVRARFGGRLMAAAAAAVMTNADN